MINIQVVSDLHLEFWSKKEKFGFVKPTSPILALLGDICCLGSDDDFSTFKRFINEILPLYETIIMISGNHEYYFNPSNEPVKPTYNNTMQGIDEKLKTYFKITSPKLHYLNNSTIRINIGKTTYTIIGSTLWTWIPDDQRKKITSFMNDYKYIKYFDEKTIRQLTSNDVATMHLKNYKYIKTQITKAKNLNHKVIVFTHHKPYVSPTYNSAGLDVAYESDLSSMFEPPVLLWCYGHTHVSDSIMKGKTWLYSNPKGYPKQKTLYNNSAVVQV